MTNIEIDGRDGHNSYMNKDHIMTDNECDAGDGRNSENEDQRTTDGGIDNSDKNGGEKD